MFQTSIWRPQKINNGMGYPYYHHFGQQSDVSPADYLYTSQRQELAKQQGRMHFQLSSSAMASASSSASSSSHCSADSRPYPPRGRSRSVRHLWAYSPERARIEVEEEEEWYRAKRRQVAIERDEAMRAQDQTAAAASDSSSPSSSAATSSSSPSAFYRPVLAFFGKAKEIISVDAPDFDERERDDRDQWTQAQEHAARVLAEAERGKNVPFADQTSVSPESSSSANSTTSAASAAESSPESRKSSAAATKTTTSSSSILPSFEAPPASTSLLPILARPPADIAEPTRLEREAYAAEEGEDDDELSYLHPPTDASNRVLYTRAQLPTLDLGSRHLWHALHGFRAVTDDYAVGYKDADAVTAPHPIPPGDNDDALKCPFAHSASSSSAVATVERIFNWSSLQLPLSLEQTWYGVLFRSVRKRGSESINLYEDDRQSHEEAVASGGLVLYWYGVPSPTTGENVASCIWTSREDAVRASRLPMHARAARHSAAAYEKFDLARYRVVKRAGEAGLRVEEWREG